MVWLAVVVANLASASIANAWRLGGSAILVAGAVVSALTPTEKLQSRE